MFKRLLVPLDGSQMAERALPIAAAIARASNAAIELVRVHEGLVDQQHDINAWKAEDQYLERIGNELRSGAGLVVSASVARGPVAQAICSRADAVRADLVVMTSHGRTGLSRSWLGSVADAVVRRSTLPVLMRKPGVSGVTGTLAERILVPHDGSKFADAVLAAACDLARPAQGQILLLRVVRPVPRPVVDASISWTVAALVPDEEATMHLAELARKELSSTLDQVVACGAASVGSHVIVAPNVAEAILDFAETHRIDAIAMATHGHGASRLFLGSIADKVLRGSTVPVLLRRPLQVIAEEGLLDEQAVEEQLPARVGTAAGIQWSQEQAERGDDKHVDPIC